MLRSILFKAQYGFTCIVCLSFEVLRYLLFTAEIMSGLNTDEASLTRTSWRSVSRLSEVKKKLRSETLILIVSDSR